jgi:ubiquinone/menaquinone biosynthesis C-methylase UbiE
VERTYVPAAGHDFFLPFYDPLQSLMGGDSARAELIAEAAISVGQRVLDIGCGTGSLVVKLGSLHPDAEVVGLDPDPKALLRARRKIERAKVAVTLDRGFADELPYESASFDRVFSSFMFHHLGPAEKAGTLAEVRRVLKPGGALHLLDFAGSSDHKPGFLANLLHSGDHMQDNHSDRIIELFREAGFPGAREITHRSSVFGRIAHYAAAVPDGSPQ